MRVGLNTGPVVAGVIGEHKFAHDLCSVGATCRRRWCSTSTATTTTPTPPSGDHHLADQFAASGFEALFVVPEAPSSARQPVRWTDLEALLIEVASHLAVPLPKTVLVFGHSGGNRTLKAWLASARVKRVVLLDGFYGDPKPFEQWLGHNGDAQLILISQVTFAKAEAWRTRLAVSLRERVLHRPAGCSHMEIVTGGKWIPELLPTSRS